MKEKIKDSLMQLKQQYGTTKAIRVAKESLKVGCKEADFKKQFNGEICEAVLEMLLRDWVKTQHEKVAWIKGLILPDAEGNNPKFLTEIDMVVFTPWCVYCIECKSYSGEKELIGKGIIQRGNGMSYDVYKQNHMHLEVLSKMIGGFSKRAVYQMILFNFSNGLLLDKRTKVNQSAFPVADEKSLIKILKKREKTVWDMEGLLMAIPKLQQFSECCRERHLAYVRSLNRKG